MPMVLCIPIDVKNKKTDFCVGLFSIYNLVAVYLHRFLANTVSLYDGVEKHQTSTVGGGAPTPRKVTICKANGRAQRPAPTMGVAYKSVIYRRGGVTPPENPAER